MFYLLTEFTSSAGAVDIVHMVRVSLPLYQIQCQGQKMNISVHQGGMIELLLGSFEPA